MNTQKLGFALAIALGLSMGPVSTDTLAARKEADKPVVIEVLKTSGRKNPKTKLSANVGKDIQKALDLYYDEKYDDSLARLEGQLKKDKLSAYEQAKLNQIKAQVLMELDDEAGAIASTQAALSEDGLPNTEYLDAKFNLAIMLSNADRVEESTQTALEWAADAPEMKGSVATLLARNYYDSEQYEKAVEWIDQAFKTSDEPQKSWYQIRVNSLYSLERYDDAIAFLGPLVDANPNEIDYMNMLVNSYIEKEDYAAALAKLSEAEGRGLLSSETQYVQIYQLYNYAGQPLDAAAALDRFLVAGSIKPTSARYIDLGEAYFESENISKALDAFTKAAELSPTDGSADAWIGAMMLDQNRVSDAKAALVRAFEKGNIKHQGNAYYNMALVEYEMKNDAAARMNAEKALAFPETKAAAESLLKNINR